MAQNRNCGDRAHPRLSRFAFFLPIALTLVAIVALPRRSDAQGVPASPDQLLQLQRGQNSTNAAVPPQPEIVLQPSSTRPAAVSSMESILSARAGTPLQQFGYDVMGSGRPVSVPQMGAVQDDYVLGAGDEIAVTLRGQENNEFRTYVDRNGQVILPRLNPIAASGRTFGAFRTDLQAAVSRAYVATSAFISIGRVRQISVLVTGNVNDPGQRILTGLSSVVDALLVSGGVKKTGSLRGIIVVRGQQRFTVDLYGYLSNRGSVSVMRLADGDRIIVPAIGPTVGIAGIVQSPGIYELKAPGISARALLDIAGGTVVRGSFLFSALRILPDGRTDLVSLGSESDVVRPSEILFVHQAADQTTGGARLSGSGALVGRFPIVTSTRLSDVLKVPGALGPTPYTLFGIIARRDPRTLVQTLIAFTPAEVLTGSADLLLRTDDIVRILSTQEEARLAKAMRAYRERQITEQELLHDPLSGADVNSGSALPTPGGDTNIQGGLGNASVEQTSSRIASAISDAQAGGGAAEISTDKSGGTGIAAPGSGASATMALPAAAPAATLRRASTSSDITAATPNSGGGTVDLVGVEFVSNDLNVPADVLMNFLLDHQITLDGAVRGPGIYLAGPNVLLSDLVMASGGTVNWADESGVELTTTAVNPVSGVSATQRQILPLHQGTLQTYSVRPHDSIRFRQVFSDVDFGRVSLQGETRFPGSYPIMRGERLSSLLARAGGLTPSAYPYGTVFLRRSVAAIEHEGFMRAAAEVQDGILVMLSRSARSTSSSSSIGDTANAMQNFARELRTQTALGRISIEADPALLAAHPESDPLLEPNDVIYIPQRPSTISVLGRVLHQGSFPYMRGASVESYIELAGGYDQFSDESETFVVLPNGSARKFDRSWLSFHSDSLPPGSTIVVPRDLSPLDIHDVLIDFSTIFSQLAIAGASLAVISGH